MNISNSITAESALHMAVTSEKELQIEMEKFFNNIRAAAEGGETEFPIPYRLHSPHRVVVWEYLKGLGYQIGYHSNSRNEIVVCWAKELPQGWREDQILPF